MAQNNQNAYLEAIAKRRGYLKSPAALRAQTIKTAQKQRNQQIPYNTLSDTSYQTTQSSSDSPLSAITDQEWYQTIFGNNPIGRSVQTVNRVQSKITTGAWKAVEGVADALLGVGGAVAGIFSDEAQDTVKDWISFDATNEWIGKHIDELTKYSYTEGNKPGEIIENIASGVGQMVPAVLIALLPGAQGTGATMAEQALATAFTGVSAGGNATEEAYNDGASYGKGLAYGTLRGGTEALTEKLVGGAVGEKVFGKGLLDNTLKGATKTVAGRVATEAVGEAAEEFTSELVNPATKTIYKGKDALKEYGTEEYWQGAGEAALVGGLTSVAFGQTLGRMYSRGSQKLDMDSVSLEELSERLTDEKVSLSDEQVQNEAKEIFGSMEKVLKKASPDKRAKLLKNYNLSEWFDTDGNIQVDPVQTVQEEVTARQETRQSGLDSNMKVIRQMADQGNQKAAELVRQMTESLAKTDGKIKTDDQKKLYQKVARVAADGVVQEISEYEQRGQIFSADLSKYSDKEKIIVQKAMDSGLLNNTQRSHALVDLVAKVSAERNLDFSFADNEGIFQSGFALEGRTVNGYVKGNEIVINVDAEGSLNAVVGHEITHVLEGTELYGELAGMMTEYAKSRGEYDSRLEETRKRYEGDPKANVEAELIADLVGEYIFNDAKFVKQLSVKNRNLFQRIYDEIKYLFKLATAGSHEARQLAKAKQVFAEVYRETKEDTSLEEGEVKYSITEPFTDLHGTYFENAVLLDTDFFDGVSPRNWGKRLNEWVKNRAIHDPVILPIIDENGEVVLLSFAKKEDRVKKTGGTDHQILNKLSYGKDNVSKLSVVHIDEIVKVSEEKIPYHTTENSHGWFDKNGWLHRNTNVINAKNGTIYNVTIDIAKTEDGRTILYTTEGSTKRVGSAEVNSLKIKGSRLNSNSTNSIPQNSEKSSDLQKISSEVKRSVSMQKDDRSESVVRKRPNHVQQDGDQSTISAPSEGKSKPDAREQKKVDDIVDSFHIVKLEDPIHVQKQVFQTLVDEEFFDENRIRLVKHQKSGMTVEINESGIDEAFSYKNFGRYGKKIKKLKLATMRMIPDIVHNGMLAYDDVNNYHNPNSKVKYAYIEKIVDIDNVPITVQVAIRKSPQKNKFWMHKIKIENSSGDLSAGISSDSKTDYHASATADDILSQNSSNVKGENKKSSRKTSDRETIRELKKQLNEQEENFNKVFSVPNLSEQERLKELMQSTVTPPKYQKDFWKNSEEIDDLLTRLKTDCKNDNQAKHLLKEMAILRNINGSYQKYGMNIEFSNGSLKESVQKQSNLLEIFSLQGEKGALKRNKDFSVLGKALLSLNDIVANAIPLETHTDKYVNTKRADPLLKCDHVLISAFQDGDWIVPVELHIKEFSEKASQPPKLYMIVSLEGIKKESRVKTIPSHEMSHERSIANLLSEDSISQKQSVVKKIRQNKLLTMNDNGEFELSQLIALMDPRFGDLFRYVPDQMLNEKQRQSKALAVAKEQQRLADMREQWAIEQEERKERQREQKASYERRKHSDVRYALSLDGAGTKNAKSSRKTSDRETIRELKKQLNEQKQIHKHENTILDILQTLKDLKTGAFINASKLQDHRFRSTIEALTKLKYRGNVRMGDTVRKQLRELHSWYTDQGNRLFFDVGEKGEIISNTKYSADIAQTLKEICEGQGELSLDELIGLEKSLTYFRHQAENFNKVFRDGKYRDAREFSERYVKLLQKHKKNPNAISALIWGYQNLFTDPKTACLIFDHFDESGFFSQTFEELRRACVDQAIDEMNLMKEWNAFFGENKAYRKHFEKDTILFRGEELSVREAFSLFMTLNREQAQKALCYSGFKLERDGQRISLPALDAAPCIEIEANSELAERIKLSEKSKYAVIAEFLIEKFARQKFSLSDGKIAIMDNRDANKLSCKANEPRIAQLGNLRNIVEKATYSHSASEVDHKKYSAFHYYAVDVKYDGEIYPLWINVGVAKNDGSNHIYTITNRNEEASTHYGVSRPVGYALQNASSFVEEAPTHYGVSRPVGYAIQNASSTGSISQENQNVNTSPPKKILTENDMKVMIEKASEELMAQFTEQDKQLIKIMKKAMDQCSEMKREIDMIRFGFSNAISGWYWPIRRANVAVNVDTFYGEMDRVTNLGFNKNTVKGAAGELLIEPVDVVFQRHVRGASMYHNLAIPTDNLNCILNLNLSENHNVPVSVLEELKNTKRGKQAYDYVMKLKQDIEQVSTTPKDVKAFNRIIRRIRSNYAKFQLGFNLKVLFTQLSSFAASTSIIKPQYLLTMLAVPNKFSDVDKYCGLAAVRNSENSAAMASGVLDKVDGFGNLLMKPIGWMDRLVVVSLFGACQQQVQAEQNLKIGTEANKKAAGKLLEQAILETQQNSLATERSSAMRSDNEILKFLTVFSADLMKVTGRVITTVGKFNFLKKQYKAATGEQKVELKKQLQEAGKDCGRSVGALIGAAAMMALIARLFRHLFAKEDEEKTWEEFFERFSFEALGNLLGGLPLIRDIYSYFSEGYEVENFFFGSMNDLLKATEGVVELTNGLMDGEEFTDQEIASRVRKAIYSGSMMFGLPTRNAYNLVNGFTRRFSPEAGYKMDALFYAKPYLKDLKAAIEAGDDKMVATVAELMVDEKLGNENETTRKAIRTLIEQGYTNVLPRVLGDTVTYEGEEIELTGEQKKRFREVYDIADRSVDALVVTKAYKEADPEIRAKAIRFIYDTYYTLALEDLTGKAAGKNTLFAEAIDLEQLAIIVATAKTLEADKDKNGNAINGSKKKKVVAYIESLRLRAAQKYMIMGYLGYKNQDGEDKVKQYVRTLKLTTAEKNALLKHSGY